MKAAQRAVLLSGRSSRSRSWYLHQTTAELQIEESAENNSLALSTLQNRIGSPLLAAVDQALQEGLPSLPLYDEAAEAGGGLGQPGAALHQPGQQLQARTHRYTGY